jgi:hypothetical protein
MQARQYKWVWLFCASLLVFQSLLPISAMASISVRCVRSSASTPDCAQSVVPVADTMGARSYFASMSCCPHRHSLFPVMFAPTCLVTVNPMNTEVAAASVSVRQWMLFASPALAPPTFVGIFRPLVGSAVAFPHLVSHLAFSPPICSHGLRAPPVV